MNKKEIELIEKEIEDNLKAGECGLASNNEKFQWTNTANAMKKMLEENKKLKDNWNMLKEYISIKLYNTEYLQKICGCRIDDINHILLDAIREQMLELEQGSGINDSN